MLGQAAQTFRTSFARFEATSPLVVVRSPSHRRMQELRKQARALLRWSAATIAPYPPSLSARRHSFFIAQHYLTTTPCDR